MNGELSKWVSTYIIHILDLSSVYTITYTVNQ